MKTTFKLVLNEGLIKLPPKLLARLELATKTVVLSYLRSSFLGWLETAREDKLAVTLDEPSEKLARRWFDEWVQANYREVKLMPKFKEQEIFTRDMGKLHPDDVPERYRHFLEHDPLHWHLEGKSLRLKLSLMSIKVKGRYNYGSNFIELGLERFKKVDWENLLVAASRCVLAQQTPSRASHFERVGREILNRVGDGINKVMGTLEHELTHYVQHNVLARIDKSQVRNGDGAAEGNTDEASDKYYASQVEFDPQIKSAIADFKSIYRKLKHRDPSYSLRALANWITGAGPRSKALPVDRAQDAFVPLKPFTFFEQLKKADDKRWRKAVKIFMKQVET